MANDRIPMTREGYEKLKADLDRMQNVEMIEVAKRIAAARELGDLSENAEYHAAREDQGMLQARIDALKDKLGPRLHRRSQQPAQGHRRLRRPGPRQGPRPRRGGGLRAGRPRRGGLRQQQDPHHQPDRPGPARQEDRRGGRDQGAPRPAPLRDPGD